MLSFVDKYFDVYQLRQEIAANPQLWDEFDIRTNHPQSPHREMSDIFVRYNARENFKGDRHRFNDPHEPVWWKAAEKLPAVQPIVADLMQAVGGIQLGMVLITRLPAGKECYPHIDMGWHATTYSKYAVQIASHPKQHFYVENERLSAVPGECYFFDNSKRHGVVNASDQDRVTMIVCIQIGDVSCR